MGSSRVGLSISEIVVIFNIPRSTVSRILMEDITVHRG